MKQDYEDETVLGTFGWSIEKLSQRSTEEVQDNDAVCAFSYYVQLFFKPSYAE